MIRTEIPLVTWMALVGLIGCQSTNDYTAGHLRSEAEITAAVHARLTTDRALNFSQLDVGMDKGVVILKGVVPSPEDKERMTQLARQVDGVKQVSNSLHIRSPSGNENFRDIRQEHP